MGLIYGASAGSGSYDKARQLMHAQSDDGRAVGAVSLTIGLLVSGERGRGVVHTCEGRLCGCCEVIGKVRWIGRSQRASWNHLYLHQPTGRDR